MKTWILTCAPLWTALQRGALGRPTRLLMLLGAVLALLFTALLMMTSLAWWRAMLLGPGCAWLLAGVILSGRIYRALTDLETGDRPQVRRLAWLTFLASLLPALAIALVLPHGWAILIGAVCCLSLVLLTAGDQVAACMILLVLGNLMQFYGPRLLAWIESPLVFAAALPVSLALAWRALDHAFPSRFDARIA